MSVRVTWRSVCMECRWESEGSSLRNAVPYFSGEECPDCHEPDAIQIVQDVVPDPDEAYERYRDSDAYVQRKQKF